jgi:3-oxoacyl-[acyl-carrier protein] reductase
VPPKVVVVTGGTGALGAAIVRALCAASKDENAHLQGASKYFVVANYQRDAERAELLRRETGCALSRADITDEGEVEAMFAACPAPYAIVHAAARTHDALLFRTSESMWRDTMRDDLDAAFLIARAALRGLQNGGRLIFLSSRVGESGAAGQGAYAAAKAAVFALMRAAAREGAARDLAINALCPGFVPSAMTQKTPPAATQLRRARSVFARDGEAQAVASAVLWLLEAESRDVSGQVIHCDSRLPFPLNIPSDDCP